MKIEVVTGHYENGYREYGKRCLESFDRHWPANVKLTVYTEYTFGCPGAEIRHLYDLKEASSFLARHHDNPHAQGRQQKPGTCWKKKDSDAGYNFRFDALKFCKMAFYTADAARRSDADVLIWLDGDVLTFADVPGGFLENVIPDGHTCAFLGREPYHSETGFVAFTRSSAIPRLWGDMYSSDSVFKLPEWHSAYCFDIARKTSGEKCHNLTPGGKKHVWFASPLGTFSDHLKGRRKAQGYSNERFARAG